MYYPVYFFSRTAEACGSPVTQCTHTSPVAMGTVKKDSPSNPANVSKVKAFAVCKCCYDLLPNIFYPI